ncbi:conjugal transfer protein TraX [Serratia marcescens]|uniref:conjugal transfer protein TraX n=1 Tax=Serratia marcescens TaxID=615 RepID=UPI0006999C43|nr:conjugal transfer protein TraX [Serratia marcescens]
MTEDTRKPSLLRRAGKGAWAGAKILFPPLAETNHIANTVGSSWQNHLKRAGKNVAQHSPKSAESAEQLSFAEAVAASGQTRAALQARFYRRKCLSLTLTALPVMTVTALLTLTVLSGWQSPWLLLRVGVISLALLALTGLLFVKTLVCTWRLWQLREGRQSPAERGGFTDFVHERGWFISTLTPER